MKREPAESRSPPRTLKAGTKKWAFVTGVGLLFVVAGIFMIRDTGSLMAWFATLFFGLVAIVGLVQLLGYGSTLELDADGFTLTNFGRVTKECWVECADFAVWRSGGNEMVGYNRARDVDTHMEEMNKMLSGRSATLPDTFGMSGQELANLMNTYQAASVERAWQRHVETVAKFQAMIAGGLADAETSADIITDPAAMALTDDMSAWLSILVVAKQPRPDGSRHILICADILSPTSRWITQTQKRDNAFDTLSADELQIIDPDTNAVERLFREA